SRRIAPGRRRGPAPRSAGTPRTRSRPRPEADAIGPHADVRTKVAPVTGTDLVEHPRRRRPGDVDTAHRARTQQREGFGSATENQGSSVFWSLSQRDASWRSAGDILL